MKILNYSKLLIAISLLIIISGIFIISTFGFKTSIEYTGGTVFSFNSTRQEDLSSIKGLLKELGFETSEVSQDKQLVKIKVSETNADKVVEIKDKILSSNKDFKLEGIETVGSSMGI